MLTKTVAVLFDLQAHELHTKHSAEAMKAEKWQFEFKNLHDKYDALLKEKEVSLLTPIVEIIDIVSTCHLIHAHIIYFIILDYQFAVANLY